MQILEGAEQEVPERLREMADRSRKSFKGKGGARGIVFCGTKRRCDFIDRKMKAMGLRSAGAIHGDKDQAEREYSLDLFRKGKAPLLVATDVAARGLDIPGVTVVLVYDFPLQVSLFSFSYGQLD